MKKHWRATAESARATIYVVTVDNQSEQAETIEKARVRIEATDAHRRLALDAISNYAWDRGLRLTGPVEEMDSTPTNLREVAWLSDFGSPENRVPISATVYERSEL